MSDPHEQPRLQAFAAAALINFTDQCSPSTLRPHLPDLFKSLLALLKGGRRFVQEAAVKALAGVIGAASSVTPAVRLSLTSWDRS